MIVKSHLLDQAARYSKRFEDAEAKMRREWPEPSKDTVKEWNASRALAERATAEIMKGGRR